MKREFVKAEMLIKQVIKVNLNGKLINLIKGRREQGWALFRLFQTFLNLKKQNTKNQNWQKKRAKMLC